jgi:hypothetical protein
VSGGAVGQLVGLAEEAQGAPLPSGGAACSGDGGELEGVGGRPEAPCMLQPPALAAAAAAPLPVARLEAGRAGCRPGRRQSSGPSPSGASSGAGTLPKGVCSGQ